MEGVVLQNRALAAVGEGQLRQPRWTPPEQRWGRGGLDLNIRGITRAPSCTAAIALKRPCALASRMHAPATVLTKRPSLPGLKRGKEDRPHGRHHPGPPQGGAHEVHQAPLPARSLKHSLYCALERLVCAAGHQLDTPGAVGRQPSTEPMPAGTIFTGPDIRPQLVPLSAGFPRWPSPLPGSPRAHLDRL